MKKAFLIAVLLSVTAATAWANLGAIQTPQVDHYTDQKGNVTKGFMVNDQYFYEDATGDTLRCQKSGRIYLCG